MRYGFWAKVAIAAVLVIAFDQLFPADFAGAGVGGFAIAWTAGVALARRDVRHSRHARIALVAALVFAATLVDDPGVLAWTLFWTALAMAALLPRAVGFDDAWHWAVRLALHVVTGIATPFRDLRRLHRRGAGGSPGRIAATLALPLVGAALFLALFAGANPLIAQALAAIELPLPGQAAIWAFVAACIWPSLRPHPTVLRLAARVPDPEPRLPGTSLPSVLIALALFNAIFAVQNGLDVAFLWSDAALPVGMSQTEYVHRGAYPLIATALIAGVMALAMLRPGSASAAHPWARRLVALWVAQNLVLVASSALRTIDYIRDSMLTGWRIAALLWMALVAVGLATIAWRILRGRSARWLVNVNAAAAAIVLTPCAFLNLGAIAARWNVAAAAPARIDLVYLETVGDGAILPLIALERRATAPATRARVTEVRKALLTDLDARQNAWHYWTPRGARRLAAAHAALGARP